MSNTAKDDKSSVAASLSGERHPFGGCNIFLRQYSLVGLALLRYERNCRRLALGSDRWFKNLREELSFIPVEMLESYLEDLLDLEVPDERLFLERSFILNRSVPIALFGIFASVLAGMYLAREGISLVVSTGITSALAVPFLVLFYVSPRGAMARRLMFAQVLSLEVARRRGHDGTSVPRGFSPSVILGGLFQQRVGNS